MAKIANLKDKIWKVKMNPLFELPVGDDTPRVINMLIETPMGSINKFEFHTKTGLLKLDQYFVNFRLLIGAIPQTWDEDESA
jgi:inorganic pyrophosphatase